VNRTPYIAAGVLFVLIAAYGFVFIKNGWSTSPEAWGQLGDYIGGLLNPLVAGFALMAVVVSVRLQKAELTETRRELENSRLAMEDQAMTAEQQRQEQRFFDLFNIYQRTVESIGVSTFYSDNSSTLHHGKEAIRIWINHQLPSELRTFQRHGLGVEISAGGEKQIIDKKLLALAWQRDSASANFDHYFRIIYRLLADSEPILGQQHYRYVKLLRAQLNRNELTLLGFNMWLNEEGMKMIPLAEKYGLLKHLQPGKLRDCLEKELPPHVFGRVNSFKILLHRSSAHAD